MGYGVKALLVSNQSYRFKLHEHLFQVTGHVEVCNSMRLRPLVHKSPRPRGRGPLTRVLLAGSESAVE